MLSTARFDEFREILRYRKRVKGSELEKIGINPEILQVKNEEQLEALLRALELELPEFTIEVRIDPLFGRHSLHTTLISEERANRPGLKKQKPQYTRDNVKEFIKTWLVGIEHIARGQMYLGSTTLDDLLDIFDRCKETLAERDCDFEEPRVYRENVVLEIHHPKKGIISVPNLYPYISPHYVTVFTKEHRLFLANLPDSTKRFFSVPTPNLYSTDYRTVDTLKAMEEALLDYLNTGKDIANLLKTKGYDGMWDFINWGSEAGGTQPHSHAQRGALYKSMTSLVDQESRALERRIEELDSQDPFEWYMQLVRDSSLLIYEDEHVFVCAPFAPRFTDQVDVFTKRKGVRNYIDLQDGDMQAVSAVMAKVLTALRKIEYEKAGKKFVREITNVNVMTHQERFGRDKNIYRMHWHIYPREAKIAGMELNNIYVVSAYPEDTARALTEPTPSK